MNHFPRTPCTPRTVALALLGLALPICADATVNESAALPESAALDEGRAQAIEECLQAVGPGFAVQSVRPAPIAGLLEVEVDGGEYLYVSEDCRYLLAGNLYELREDGVVGITERRRNVRRRALLADVPTSQMLVYSPEDGAKASVTVFTDTDCGYCRHLHTSMAEYHAHGIEVRYVAYPRAGIGSPTYENMVSAWCANDPLAALTALKRGEEIPKKSCVNPVAEQYELGQQVGLTGTPALVLPDGDLVNGLVDAEQLAAMLGI